MNEKNPWLWKYRTKGGGRKKGRKAITKPISDKVIINDYDGQVDTELTTFDDTVIKPGDFGNEMGGEYLDLNFNEPPSEDDYDLIFDNEDKLDFTNYLVSF